jgi:hypothetical protein
VCGLAGCCTQRLAGPHTGIAPRTRGTTTRMDAGFRAGRSEWAVSPEREMPHDTGTEGCIRVFFGVGKRESRASSQRDSHKSEGVEARRGLCSCDFF